MLIDGLASLSRRPLAAALGLTLAVGLLPGCGGPYEPLRPAPQFALEDVNPASATHGELRAPEDLRGKVLLLYFVSYG